MHRLVQSVWFTIAISAGWQVVAATAPDFSPAARTLERAIGDRAFPGCSVVVGTDTAVLWSASFGHFDYENKTPVARETIYDLASVTKVAGTTAVYMRLVALEKVRVSDAVEKHLPEFIAAATGDAEREQRRGITLEHLLTHTAGLASWKPLYRSVNSYAELLRAVMETPLVSEPGAKFRYSDLGMILLGEIASRAGGKPLAELERELVFVPLGMKDTLRNPPAALHPRIPPTERVSTADGATVIHGAVHDENARAGEGITGHAGLFSTAEDLGRLAAELLRGLDGRSKLFPREVVADFIRARSFDPDSPRGLGWGVGRDSSGNRKPTINHMGFTGTSIWIDTERKLYMVLLTNRVHPTRDNNKISRVRSQAADAVLQAFDQFQSGRADAGVSGR